jgi:putative tricarboxylic transport membrane protein
VIAASTTFLGITVAFGNKRHARAAIFGVLFITIVYLAFTQFLNVPLPAGIFKGLL